MKTTEALKVITDKQVRDVWSEYTSRAKKTASIIGIMIKFVKKREREKKGFIV